jgi:hypothetical protein
VRVRRLVAMGEFDEPTNFEIDDSFDLTEEERDQLREATPAPDWNLDVWEAEVKSIAKVYSEHRWELGALLDKGFTSLGAYVPNDPSGKDFYSYVSRLTGLEPSHLKDMRSTWKRWDEIAPSVRTDKLSWSHHRILVNELAKPTEENLKEWVGKCVENDWSCGDLLKALHDKGAGKPKDTHTFRCTVPKRTWAVLKNLGKNTKGPEYEAAGILITECDHPDVILSGDYAKKQADEKTHAARVKNGRRVARAYNPRGLPQD